MENDLKEKINAILRKKDLMSENEIQALLIIIRKLLERMSNEKKEQYLTILLFCDWSAHVEISRSLQGLKILSRINNALVNVSKFEDTVLISRKISEAIGFAELRKELNIFLMENGIVNDVILDNKIWGSTFLINLIEILKDTPLVFPRKLKPKQEEIYNSIANNSIKPGAGVISICISNFNYPNIENKNLNIRKCIHIITANAISVVVPLTIDVSQEN